MIVISFLFADFFLFNWLQDCIAFRALVSVSVFTVNISDSGFLDEVKLFLAKGVSTLLLSWEGDLQNVTNSSNGFLFLSCFLSTMALGVVSSLNSVAQFFFNR